VELNEQARANDPANLPVPPGSVPGAPDPTALEPRGVNDNPLPEGRAPVGAASIACERCGVPLDPNVRFCGNCGYPARVYP